MSNKVNKTIEETSPLPEAEGSSEETAAPETIVSEVGRRTVGNFDITGKDPIIKDN